MKTVLTCSVADADKWAAQFVRGGIVFERRSVSENEMEQVHFLVEDASFDVAADFLESVHDWANENADLSRLQRCPKCGEMGAAWLKDPQDKENKEVFVCVTCQRSVAVRDPKTKIGRVLD